MGCNGSQPIQEINAEESEAVNLSKEHSVNENVDQPRQAKADGMNTTANLLQDANPTAKERNSLKRPKAKRDGEEIIENAWGVSKVKKNLENAQSRPKQEGLADVESEYGKDGVDLASSHVQGNQDKEKLIHNSSGARMSPEGTHSVDYSERMGMQRSIHKVNTMLIN